MKNKHSKIFLIYILPALVVAALYIAAVVWAYYEYASFTDGKMVSGNAEAWVFLSMGLLPVACVVYTIYFIIVFTARKLMKSIQQSRKSVKKTRHTAQKPSHRQTQSYDDGDELL